MEAKIADKIHNGTITIRDLEPGLTTEGKIRGAGYVPFSYEKVLDQIQVLEGLHGNQREVLKAFPGSSSYGERLYNTQKRIEEEL